MVEQLQVDSRAHGSRNEMLGRLAMYDLRTCVLTPLHILVTVSSGVSIEYDKSRNPFMICFLMLSSAPFARAVTELNIASIMQIMKRSLEITVERNAKWESLSLSFYRDLYCVASVLKIDDFSVAEKANRYKPTSVL